MIPILRPLAKDPAMPPRQLVDRLEPDAARLVGERCATVRLRAGDHAFRAGDDCGAYLWVTDGVVRVQIVTESGRERLLYRVAPGDSCVLTTSCLFDHEPYAAEGICETDVTATAIPVPAFRELLGLSPTFRDLVLADYARRVGDMLVMLDVTQSRQLGARLAAFLLERSRDGRPVEATHHEIAVELGSAREVVSRALKDFERRGFVTLSRGRVSVADRAGLARAGHE
jgi:CRP/FNR family transcriptional regulator